MTFGISKDGGLFRSLGDDAISLHSEDHNWKSADRGTNHNVMLKSDGSLWAEGNNADGQLGAGTTDSHSGIIQVGEQEDWTSVAAGDFYNLAPTEDGNFWSWGRGTGGLLGTGDTAGRLSPALIEFPSRSDFASYEEWREEVFQEEADNDEVSGPLQTPGGIANLLAFALDLNPLGPDLGRLPAVEFASDGEGAPYLTLSYTRAKYRQGVSERIEVSPDLHHWEPLPPENITVIPEGIEAERITGSVPIDEDTDSRHFLRLHLTDSPLPSESEPPSALSTPPGRR